MSTVGYKNKHQSATKLVWLSANLSRMAFTARAILILFTLLVVAATFTQATYYPHCRYRRCYGYYKFNRQTCRCDRCLRVYCYSGTRLDPSSCRCVPVARPPSPPTSPPTPPPTRPPVCPPPKVYVPSRRRCVCPSSSCGSGQTLDPNTCECVCSRSATCNALQRFNSDTCKCECVEVIPKPVTRLTTTRDDDTTGTRTDTSRSPGTRTGTGSRSTSRGGSSRSSSKSSRSGKSSKSGSSRKRRDEPEAMDPQLEAIAGPDFEQDVLEMEKRSIEKRSGSNSGSSGKSGSSSSRGRSRSPGSRSRSSGSRSSSPGTRSDSTSFTVTRTFVTQSRTRTCPTGQKLNERTCRCF